MTTPPHGQSDPVTTTTFEPLGTSTPIGDGAAHDSGLTQDVSSDGGDDATGGSPVDKAHDAVGSAAEHGQQVAGTAKDEATKVAAEAKDKATDLLADVRSQVDEQSKAQLQGLAAKLGELADEIDSLVSGSDTNGTATGVARQLADKTHQLSAHLEGRQPLDLLEDVRGLARRRPAAFLAGAAVAGVLAGRLTRGAKADTPPSGSSSTSSDSTTTATTTTAAPVATGSVLPPPVVDVPDGQNTGGRQ